MKKIRNAGFTGWLLLSALLLAGPVWGQASRSDTGPRLEDLLKHGEYAAAQQLAAQAGSAAERDRMLATIAQSQSRNRLGTQAVRSVARIQDDVLRNRVLHQIRQVGVGPNVAPAFGGPGLGGGLGPVPGAGGGAAIADFDPLIELIQNTIDPQSWLDTNGGPGTINEFRSGVTVDATGVLNRVEYSAGNGQLADLRKDAARKTIQSDLWRDSDLRKVSLTRLEKACQLLAAEGKSPTLAMENLAGIYEIRYLLVYPETGDIVIAGPAGDWKTDVEGTSVNVKTGKPVLRLDDLVVLLRNAIEFDGKFGCSIDPRQANLEATQRFIATANLMKPQGRDGLREALGMQDISVDGIDPESIVARVIVEADYRMKLVGMDLEKGVPGVESILSRVQLDKNGRVPPTDVMRLEFVLNYDSVSVTDAKDAFQLNGQGVQVVSAKELVNQKGERIQAGKSTGPAADFAHGFTRHFESMAQRYPIYAQLKNVFDLAMVVNLIRLQKLDRACDWQPTFFGPFREKELVYETRRGLIPREVKTVMNYREIPETQNGRKVRTHLFVGISGGVSFDAQRFLRGEDSIVEDQYGKLKLDRKSNQPAGDHWWWD